MKKRRKKKSKKEVKTRSKKPNQAGPPIQEQSTHYMYIVIVKLRHIKMKNSVSNSCKTNTRRL